MVPVAQIYNVDFLFRNKRVMPANKAGLFSFITINWLTRMMWKAFRSNLTQEDLYYLDVSTET